MKRAIIREQLKLIICSVLASAGISALLCFFLFFNGRAADNDLPQHLIWNIGDHLTKNGRKFGLDEKGRESLNTHDLWLQVVNADGDVLYETNSRGDLPAHYTNSDLVDAVMHPDAVKGYTVFLTKLKDREGTSILLGCDSRRVKKYTYTLSGSRKTLLVKCLFCFFATAACVIMVSSYLFSRKITLPISRAVEDISRLSKGEKVSSGEEKKGAFFSDVFSSIQKLQADLAKNEKLRVEWIVNISHDIKTPLSTIKGYAELLTMEGYEFDKEEIRSYGNQILASEEAIKGLVDELKTTEALKKGAGVLRREPTLAVDFVRDCIEEARRYSQPKKPITFSHSSEPVLDIDRKLLSLCLINLICNAFVHNDKSVQVKVSLEEEDGSVLIRVCDDGKGMGQEDLDHVFERYYRGMDAGKVKGTGLGLAIAKEVVLAHGGQIQAFSKIGRGTVFELRLPKTDER